MVGKHQRPLQDSASQQKVALVVTPRERRQSRGGFMMRCHLCRDSFTQGREYI